MKSKVAVVAHVSLVKELDRMDHRNACVYKNVLLDDRLVPVYFYQAKDLFYNFCVTKKIIPKILFTI